MTCKHEHELGRVCKACEKRIYEIDRRAEWLAVKDTRKEIKDSLRQEGLLVMAGKRKQSLYGGRG